MSSLKAVFKIRIISEDSLFTIALSFLSQRIGTVNLELDKCQKGGYMRMNLYLPASVVGIVLQIEILYMIRVVQRVNASCWEGIDVGERPSVGTQAG